MPIVEMGRVDPRSLFARFESTSLMQRRIREVLALDPSATALTFRGLTFPWSCYSDAIAVLESSLAGHPPARRIGIVLRNRPGPLARWSPPSVPGAS